MRDPTAMAVIHRETRRERNDFWRKHRHRGARATVKLDGVEAAVTVEPDDHATRMAAGEPFRARLRELRVKNAKVSVYAD